MEKQMINKEKWLQVNKVAAEKLGHKITISDGEVFVDGNEPLDSEVPSSLPWSQSGKRRFDIRRPSDCLDVVKWLIKTHYAFVNVDDGRYFACYEDPMGMVQSSSSVGHETFEEAVAESILSLDAIEQQGGC